jgi:predicted RNA binding protein YcfA (HicA-like mRNA interferase family)
MRKRKSRSSNLDIDSNIEVAYIPPVNNNGRAMDSRTIIKLLKADGWVLVHAKGSHHQFRHPTKKGKTTVKHPTKDFPIGTLKSMERQSGLKFT